LSKRTLFVVVTGIWLLMSPRTVPRVWSQGVPPPPPHPPGAHPGPPRLDEQGIGERIQRVRSRLSQLNVKDKDSERLISIARRELGRAEEKLRGNQLYAADRLQAASDAFMHAAEHSVHLEEDPKGPVPQATEIADHLQRVYFRLQQADFFAGSSGETDVKALPPLARRFYEQARKAYDSGSWFAADEYAKSADDTIRGLENLAQAAVPEPPRPPGPR
jgi:hypothetical protein